MNDSKRFFLLKTFLTSSLLFILIFLISFVLNRSEFKDFIQFLFSQGFSFHDSFKENLLVEHANDIFIQGYIAFGKNFEKNFIQYFLNFNNALSLFFSYKTLPFFNLVMTGIKVALASITFYMFLGELPNANHRKILFSILYGFIGFGGSYFLSPLWMDTLVMFPLLILGLNRYIYQNKKKLVIGSFLLILLNNPNNLISIWIVTTLYFISQIYILNNEKLKISLFNYIKLLLWTIGLSAFFLIPLLHNNDFLKHKHIQLSEILNFNWISNFLVGNNVLLKDSLIPLNILSLFIIVGAISFFMQDHRTKKEKISYGSLLVLLFIFSSYHPATIFYSTTNIKVGVNPYQLYLSFFLIWFSYRSYLHWDETKNKKKIKQILKYLLCSLTILLLLININLTFFKNYLSVLWVFISIIILCLYYFIINCKKTPLLMLLVFSELLFNQSIQLSKVTEWVENHQLNFQQNNELSSSDQLIETWFRNKNPQLHQASSPLTNLLLHSTERGLGFYSKTNLHELPMDDDYIKNQNLVVQKLLETDEKFFEEVYFEIYTSNNASLTQDSTKIRLIDQEKPGLIHFKLNIQPNETFYILLENLLDEEIIMINGTSVQLSQWTEIKNESEDSWIDLKWEFKSEQEITYPRFLIINQSLEEKLMKHLNENKIVNHSTKANEIKINIPARYSNHFLFMNLQQNKNWKLQSNYQMITSNESSNDLIHFKLSNLNNEDLTLILTYEFQLVKLGFLITCLSICLFFIKRRK